MKILLCAATSAEYGACLSGVSSLSHPHQFTVLKTGMGAQKAERALRAHLKALPESAYDWIISTGFAGSRVDSLKLGNFILADSVRNTSGETLSLRKEPWIKMLDEAKVEYSVTQVQLVDEVVNESSEYSGAITGIAVDMESYALAKVAEEFSTPFQVIRLISDTVDQPIPDSIKAFSKGAVSGLIASAKSPKKLLGFVAQTARLPGELKNAWKAIGQSAGLFLLLASGMLFVACPSAHAITVDEYLNEVTKSHDGYKSLEEDSHGAKASGGSADLMFKPQVFTTFQYTYDPRDTHSVELYGDHTLSKSLSAGFREQTPWGLALQLSLDYNQDTLLGISSPLITRPTVTNLYPVPVFKWSIWQNFGGRMDRANQRMEEAKSRAQEYGSDFGAKALLVEAEGRYWKLAALREVIKLQRGSLTRAQSVFALDTKKVRAKLIDSGDALLSESAVQGKELELRSMVSEERSAARAFNSSRGLDSDQVDDVLVLPSQAALKEMKLPVRAGTRGDLKMAEQQAAATQAGYEVAHEKLLPDVSVFGSIFAMGLSFSMPMDLALTSDARGGYAQQSKAAELNLKRKQFEQENEWSDLQTRFQDNLERLDLAVKLEDLQRRKFEDANRRRAHAMTVAFQVFQYELDYMSAAQARLQIEGTLLGLRAQAKLYAGEAEASAQ